MNPVRKLFAGVNKDERIQNVFDYSLGAALGISGQSILNAATDGYDPNAVISGALMAPALTYGLRRGRTEYFKGRPIPETFNQGLLNDMDKSPYQKAALYGSAASIVGGLGGSAYNTVAGGNDIDNNIPAAALATIAPIAAYLVSKARNNYMAKVGEALEDFDVESYVNSIKKQVDDGLL